MRHAEDDRSVALVEHAKGVRVVRSDELDELSVVAFVGHGGMIAESGRSTHLIYVEWYASRVASDQRWTDIDPERAAPRTYGVSQSTIDGGLE